LWRLKKVVIETLATKNCGDQNFGNEKFVMIEKSGH
jgi:hypothetical protein